MKTLMNTSSRAPQSRDQARRSAISTTCPTGRLSGCIAWGAGFRRLALTWALAWVLAAAGAATAASPAPGEGGRKVIPIFRLSGQLTETPGDESLPLFAMPGTSLKDLVARLQRAAEDPSVKAVVILPDAAQLGAAQVEELRAAIGRIRARDKEVYVHGDSLTMTQYVLACGATRISVTPTGMILAHGLHASTLHVRGLLDKLGVKPDFLTCGAFKSAAEMYMREQPSPEAEQMMNWLMDSWQASQVESIAKGRNVAAAKVREWLDGGLYTAEKAKADGLIDAVEQQSDFEGMLKNRHGQEVVFEKKYGRKKQPEVDFSSPFAFLKIWSDVLGGLKAKSAAKPVVGIVYVDGAIMPGKGQPSPLGGSLGAFSSDVREALEKAAEDDNVKAVVLRVDSPGGSATASEIILEATQRLKARKPLVVSMGAVAGSGGYYVACAADTIFADASTLTGSIGVLSGKLATTEMWKKAGITFKEYKRGQNSGILSTDAVFTDSERARMRMFVDEVYEVFKKHVQDIRGKRLTKPLEELAGGRVYTGRQALELGLVDRLGTLHDAVAFAAGKAGLKDYDAHAVPEPKSFIEQLMEELSGNKDNPGHIQAAAAGDSLLKLAAPYLLNLDPERTAAVYSALRRLEILSREGVVLGMPEILQQ